MKPQKLHLLISHLKEKNNSEGQLAQVSKYWQLCAHAEDGFLTCFPPPARLFLLGCTYTPLALHRD